MRLSFRSNPNKLAKFDLALSLGKTVAELEATLPQREFLEWITYLRMEPRGHRRTDYNFAWLVYNMRRLIGDKKAEMSNCLLSFKDPSKNIETMKKTNKGNVACMLMLVGRGPNKKSKRKMEKTS